MALATARRSLLALAWVITGCSPSVSETATPPTSSGPRASVESFEAVVRVPLEPGPGKGFRGIMLERDDGERWVVSYEGDELWARFADQRVKVSGSVYQPEGQALMQKHFRIDSLEVVAPGDTMELISVGPEEIMEGRLTVTTAPAGSKLEGETQRNFLVGGLAHRLAKEPPDLQKDKPVKVRARKVASSPAATRTGGPALWILEIVP